MVQPLFIVIECKYLGLMLTETLSIDKDFDRMTSNIWKQFNSLFYKFNYVDRKVPVLYIYSWAVTGCKRYFQKLSINYHKVVKSICSMNVWESNHDACKIAEVHIFKYLYAKRRASFMYSLLKSNSPCVLQLRIYF